MGLFSNFKKKNEAEEQPNIAPPAPPTSPNVKDYGAMAKLALNTIKDGFLVVGGDRNIKLINPAGINITGCQDESLALGFDVGLCVKLARPGSEPLADAENPFLQAITKNQTFKSQDLEIISKDGGKRIPVEVNVATINDASADRIVTIRDISAEKAKDDMQSEFISTASHEMRTPVASIEGYLGLALNPQTATIDARARGYLEAAQKASKHLGALFRDLLDVTKLEDGRMQPHMVPLELTSFIKQIADEFAPSFAEKNLTYYFGDKNSNQSMRTLSQPIYVYADANFLREIASNLIENAIKYTPAGKIIWISVQGDDTRAMLIVEDSGVGIPSNDLPHIFQKFYRVDNTDTREVNGTGLGLYIVKQRAKAMGGDALARSVYGKGSAFIIVLPRLSREEYEKRRIILLNEAQAQQQVANSNEKVV